MEAKELIIGYQKLYKDFDARKYKRAFEKYTADVSDVLFVINKTIENSDDPSLVIEEQAKSLVNAVRAETIDNKRIRFRSSRKLLLDDYRLTLAFFVLPMLQKSQFTFSKDLALSILDFWRKEDLGYIEMTNYEDLLKGFDRSIMDVFLGRN